MNTIQSTTIKSYIVFFGVFGLLLILFFSGLTQKFLVSMSFVENIFQTTPPPVKYTNNIIEGSLPITFFSTLKSHTLYIQPVSKELFGGSFSYIQNMQFLHFIIAILVLFLIFSLAFIALKKIVKNTVKLNTTIILALISIISILVSIKVAQGWDELFINLRHSAVFSKKMIYSYNFNSLFEGTVDFLPFFLAGILGLIGVPLIEAIISITLMGNVLIILSCYLLVYRITNDRFMGIAGALLAGLLPCTVFVGGTGFTATIFTGVILFSLYFLFINQEKYLLGLVILGGLTLVRTEGILLAFLFFIYRYVIKDFRKYFNSDDRKKLLVQAFLHGSILGLPFLLSALVRYLAFGSILPNPMVFKNANGDFSYLRMGIIQFKIMLLSFHIEKLLVLIGASYFLIRKKISLAKYSLSVIGLILLIFSLPYYYGGGDWFPYSWSRYAMPLIVFIFIVTFILFYLTVKVYFEKIQKTIFFLISLGLIFIFIFQHASDGRIPISSFKVLAIDLVAKEINRWYRVDNFSMLGRFLRQTTSSKITIASPELATIMYFAERDILGLLGIANPDIAKSPLDPIGPGDVLHRKRNPQTLEKHRPEIIILCEMYTTIPMFLDGKPFSIMEEFKQKKFSSFSKKLAAILKGTSFRDSLVNIAYYRVGSYEYLQSLGYRHIAVFFPQLAFNYFVHEKYYNEHVNYLKKMDFHIIGSSHVKYKYDQNLTQRFSDGIKIKHK